MCISGWHNARRSQMALALTRLMRQLMAHEGPFHFELASSRLAETLGGAAFRL
jgi:hypothetical protein